MIMNSYLTPQSFKNSTAEKNLYRNNKTYSNTLSFTDNTSELSNAKNNEKIKSTESVNKLFGKNTTSNKIILAASIATTLSYSTFTDSPLRQIYSNTRIEERFGNTEDGLYTRSSVNKKTNSKNTVNNGNSKKMSEEKLKEMEKEIEKEVFDFETKIIYLSLTLFLAFLILTIPALIGVPAIVGLIGSLGLYVYILIRRWERGVGGSEKSRINC